MKKRTIKDKDNNYEEYGSYADEITLAVEDVCRKLDKHNINIGLSTWFVILGQYFDDLVEIRKNVGNIPLRFSLFVIQDSRSGKNTNVNIIRKIADKIGVTNTSPTSFTEKAIIGLADTKAIEFNKKLASKIKQDPDKYNESMYQDEFRQGMMEKYDLLIVEEAKNLFKGSHKENLILYIQEILDCKGTINVSTGTSGDFLRPATCSFIMTTIPFEDSNVESIIDDGFFQRFAILKRSVDKEEFKERDDMYIDAYTDALDFGETELAEFVKKVSLELKKTKSILTSKVENMSKNDKNLKIEFDNGSGAEKRKLIADLSPDAKDMMKKYIKKYKEDIEDNFFGDIVKKIDSFTDIFVTLYVKVGTISMILKRNKKHQIEPSDIIYANEVIVEKTYYGLVQLIAQLGKKNNNLNIRYARAIGDTWIDENYTYKKLSSHGKLNLMMAEFKLKELVEKKYIDMEIDNNTEKKMYRCSKKVFEITLFDKDLEKYDKNTSKPYKLFKSDEMIVHLSYYLDKLEQEKIEYNALTFKGLREIFFKSKNKYSNYHHLIEKLRNNEILPVNKDSFKLLVTPSKFDLPADNEIMNYTNTMLKLFKELKKLKEDYKKDGYNKKMIETKLNEFEIKYKRDNNIKVPKLFK